MKGFSWFRPPSQRLPAEPYSRAHSPLFRGSRSVLLGALLALAAVIVWVALRTSWHSDLRQDPKNDALTLARPYRNTDPVVKYVGDAACAGCHQEQYEAFRHHPMNHTFEP